MSTKRPSYQKRERELKKKERRLRKAARAAEKRAAQRREDGPTAATEKPPLPEDGPCSP